MKAKTKAMLSKLSESESRASLEALLFDIRDCDAEELQTFLSKKYPELQKSKAKKRVKARSLPANDLPVTRIAHSLRQQSFETDEIAIKKLSSALIARGVNAGAIPPPSVKGLEIWLQELIANVSESTVLSAAQKVRP